MATVDLSKVDFGELGTTGLRRHGGLINEEFLRELKGRRAHSVYREMSENDPTIRGFLFAVEMLLRNISWRVEAGGETPADMEAQEFVEGCMDDMSHTWADFISEALSMLAFGWSYHEICYKRRSGDMGDAKSHFDDGKIGWRKLPIRGQSTLLRWEFDDRGGLRAMVQQDPMQGHRLTVPIEKALLFRTRSLKNNPEGVSLLRGAYRPWYFKKRIEEIEAVGIERDLAGLPVMKVPARIMDSNAQATEAALYTALKDVVRNIRRDEQEGILIPGDHDENGNPLFELSLLSTGGQRQFDTSEIINRYKRDELTVVLADFIMLGQEKAGSFALSNDKTEMFELVLNAFSDGIAETINRHGVSRLLKLNAMRLDKKPKIVPARVSKEDIGQFTEAIQRLAAAGMEIFPDEDTENKIRGMLDLPEKDEEFFAGRQERADAFLAPLMGADGEEDAAEA